MAVLPRGGASPGARSRCPHYSPAMAITEDEFRTTVAGSEIVVTGSSGLVHATWRLLVDGVEVDSAAAAGDFTLRGALPDGSAVTAAVHQSLLGPTGVSISHDGAEVFTGTGFVA